MVKGVKAVKACRCRRSTSLIHPWYDMLPPEIILPWDYSISPKEMQSRASSIVNELQAEYDKVGSLKREEATFENVLNVLADLERRSENEECYIWRAQYVATDKELREASAQAEQVIRKFFVETSMRQDIFEKLKALEQKDATVLPAEMQRYLKRLIKLGERNGLHLPNDIQEQVKKLSNEINDLCIRFMKVLNEENSTIEFTQQELDGIPEDFVKSLELVEPGKRRVTMKPPHYMSVMRKAKNPETRRRMSLAYGTRCLENTPVIEKLATSRHEKAVLLGYPDNVSFVTELLMAKSRDNVHNFLAGMAEKLLPLWQKEKQVLLKLKEEECQQLGIPFDGKLNSWDMIYYDNMLKERMYGVDQEKLREYFPLETVLARMLEIYEQLLGLVFEQVPDVKLWHPGTSLYKVNDAATGELMGYFALDLFPREGKYNHFCNALMQPGCLKPDGTRQLPFVCVICNFTEPTADKPSLLTHAEVKTFFHEFGHTMHHVCSRAALAMFAGTKTERDFLECPSRMLENWVWEAEPLSRMSGHHVTGKPLPRELLEPLVASRLAGVGWFSLRYISLALLDYTIHTQRHVDTQKVFGDIQENLLQYPPHEGTNRASHFNHLVTGYDGRYYSYMWSEVFSADMYSTRFKKEGVFNRHTGMEYRKKILEPAGSKDAADLLRDFLGRAPNNEAFLISKGLSVA
ncbi:thimet oligopeptidase-like isoform X2 [Ornithodoros turicata]|uniref:thimet oligopeptidase-like isoform X2 n=1 Tax=Ornithodoros turicata TaxID=34597 RepID=UPI003138B351